MTDSEKIKAVEKYFNFSTRGLATFIGLKTPQTLYDIHKGKHGISKDLAKTLAEALDGLNIGWLLADEGEMINKTAQSDKDSVLMSREVFDLLKSQTETILSQQRTIESLSKKIPDIADIA